MLIGRAEAALTKYRPISALYTQNDLTELALSAY